MMLCSYRKKLNLTGLIGLVLAVTLLISCSDSPGDESLTPVSNLKTNLSFNVSGAKAIAASSSSSTSGSMRAASNLGDLVKIKEDGTLETAISFGAEYSWKPTVSFISVGSDKSVYICFQSVYTEWDSTTNKTTTIQFVRVYPDNHFDVLWPLDPENYKYDTDGNVSTWTWAGMDSDPLQKGDDGQLYFKVSSYAGGTTSDFVYSYNPTVGGKPVLRTPANGNLSIESFKIDSQKHLFIKSNSYGSSNYLRYYSQNSIAPVNIYYSSDSTLWVRGYTSSPIGNALILNGSGINGMSGIIRANLQTSGSPTYDLLYSSGANMGYISLQQYTGGTNTYINPTGLIDYSTTTWTYTWNSSVLTGGVLDKAKLLAKVETLFYETPTITDTYFNLLKSVTDLNAYDATYVTRDDKGVEVTHTNYPLGSIISSYPDGFLRQYFSGTLMTDWVSAQNLTNFDVGNVANLIWGTDGSLYGIYNSSVYGSSDNSTYVMKLLDAAGNKALAVVPLANGKCKPTKIKIVDGYLYYRYAVMNGTAETGYHKLARFNINSNTQEEIFTDSVLSGKNVELLSYDVSSDSSTMYISALDYGTNAVIFGKINLATKKFTQIPADASYGTVRTF